METKQVVCHRASSLNSTALYHLLMYVNRAVTGVHRHQIVKDDEKTQFQNTTEIFTSGLKVGGGLILNNKRSVISSAGVTGMCYSNAGS